MKFPWGHFPMCVSSMPHTTQGFRFVTIVYEGLLGNHSRFCFCWSMRVYMRPAAGFADAMVCLCAPFCDIVHAALHAFEYCGIGGVVANGVSDTVPGDCV